MNATGIAARNAYKSGTVQYGTTRKYTGSNAQYPAIYAQEKYSGIEVSDVADGTQVITGSVDTTAQSKMNPSGKTQSEDVYTTPTTDKLTTDATTLTCTQTDYPMFMANASSYFDDTNFYSMIFKTGTNFYLASRYVSCNSNRSYANFGLRYVRDSYLYSFELFSSNSTGYTSNFYLAPVVSLGSGIQVKSGEGTTEKPYVIGK